MPGSEVLIESDDQFLTLIQGEGTEFHILGMSREEYPELPAVQDQNRFEMPEYLLKNMINQTLFAISQNDQTPVLTGCLFDLKDGMIRVVAVDGYRVAVRNEPLQFSQECSFIVPGKTLGEITKLLSDQQDRNAEVIICDKHIVFSVNGYRVISRLLQGDYLDYQSAIPQSQTTTIHVDTRLFTQSIERTSIIINDRNKSPIKMEVLETTLNLTCESPIGKASDFCAAQIEGEQLKIAFNNKFMIDALRHAECDELLILLNGPHSPIKIVPVEGDSFLFLVLPVRLKNDN